MAYWDDNGECNLSISYDADGVPVSVAFDANIYDDFYDEDGNFIEGAEYSGIYYYVVNPQGDVIGLLDEDGNLVVEYVYDAWGAVREVHASGYYSYLARYNPLRYRGYVYDHETGLYYLQSRYYNPEMGRFINADSIAYLGADGSPLSYNLFAYCSNNPVMGYDPSGQWGWKTQLAIGLAALAVGLAVLTAIPTGGASLVVSTMVGTMVISSSTAVAAGGSLVIVGTIMTGNALIKSTSASISQAKTKGKENVRDSGLAQESDAEVQRKARDNSLSKAERRRYQTEEKARKLRNQRKRLGK